MTHLVVTAPFGEYRRGDHITDAGAIKAILADDEQHRHVVMVADGAPAPADQPKE